MANTIGQIFHTRLKKIGLFRPMKGPTVRNAKPTILSLTMSKCVTMYGENKPSTLINDTRCELNFFREIPVRSAMPNTFV